MSTNTQPIGSIPDDIAADMIGLDCGEDRKAEALWGLSKYVPLDGVKITFPVAGTGAAATVTLRSELQAYVRAKDYANNARRFGDIQTALAREAEAQAIYDRLPESWRW